MKLLRANYVNNVLKACETVKARHMECNNYAKSHSANTMFKIQLSLLKQKIMVDD